jgi:hypothetical protein
MWVVVHTSNQVRFEARTAPAALVSDGDRESGRERGGVTVIARVVVRVGGWSGLVVALATLAEVARADAPARDPEEQAGRRAALGSRVIDCPIPLEAKRGEPVTLRCEVLRGFAVGRVRLYYRPARQEQFESVLARRARDGSFSVAIPGADVIHGAIHYYLEALDFSDRVAGGSGHSQSPHILLVRGSAASDPRARPASAEPDDDNPLAEGPALRRQAPQRLRRGAGAVFLGIGAGSGVGWQPGGRRLEYYEDATIAASALPSGLLHVVPEIGYQVSDAFAISVQARLQWIQQTPVNPQGRAPASSAFAVMARAQRFLGEGRVQGTLSAYAGGGDGFRLTFPETTATTRTDTVRGGPFVAGPGVGIIVHLSPYTALTLDTRALVGFPSVAAVGDASVGVQVGF